MDPARPQRTLERPRPRDLPELIAPDELPRSALAEQVRLGHLVRVGRCAYVATDPEAPTWSTRERVHLARVRADHGTLVSGHWFARESAALLYGWPVWRCPETTVVLRDSSPGPRCAGGRRWGYDQLSTADRSTLASVCESPVCRQEHEVPLTSRLRTATDCARRLRPLHALVSLDAALRDGVEPEALADELGRFAGARGVRRARVVVPFADPGSESAGETWVRWLAVAHGMPPPTLQEPVATADGVFWLDGFWAELGLGWEYDGRSKYGQSQREVTRALLAQNRRAEVIRDVGVTLLRFDQTDGANPRGALARLRAATPPGFWGSPIPGLEPLRGA